MGLYVSNFLEIHIIPHEFSTDIYMPHSLTCFKYLVKYELLVRSTVTTLIIIRQFTKALYIFPLYSFCAPIWQVSIAMSSSLVFLLLQILLLYCKFHPVSFWYQILYFSSLELGTVPFYIFYFSPNCIHLSSNIWTVIVPVLMYKYLIYLLMLSSVISQFISIASFPPCQSCLLLCISNSFGLDAWHCDF